MTRLIKLLKNIILAPFVLYLYNLIVSPLGYIIPINFITILFVGVLGLPGLFTLFIFLLVGFN